MPSPTNSSGMKLINMKLLIDHMIRDKKLFRIVIYSVYSLFSK